MATLVPRETLTGALAMVQMALAKAGTDSLLNHVLFHVADDTVKLSAANRNLWADHTLPLPTSVDVGTFGLHGSKLIDLLKQSDADLFVMDVDPRKMTVTFTAGTSAYGLDALFDVPFPTCTEDWGGAEQAGTYPVAALLRSLSYLKVFLDPTSKQESHKLVELRNHRALAGTGRIIGIYQDTALPGALRVPAEALPGVISWLKHLNATADVILLKSSTRYYLKYEAAGQVSLIGWNQVASTFPTIEDGWLATPVRYTLVLDKPHIEKTVKRLALMLPDKQDRVTLNTLTPQDLNVSVVNSRGHRSEETLTCQREGDSVGPAFHLNYENLLDILSQLPDDLVHFHVTDRFLLIKQDRGEHTFYGIAAFKTNES